MDYEIGTVLRDKRGLDWIVLEHDRLFPERYPERFLLYRHANMLAMGDRRPIEDAAQMTPTGETFSPERVNW